MNKKKLATLVLVGMLGLTVLIGGATMALFTDRAENAGNTFGAGTLTLESHRHDVPIEGPMFYTHDNDAGWMGTGQWAPRDTHTRAMFIKNTGSLQGKLSSIQAIAESDEANARAFGEQAQVTIAVFEAPAGSDFAANVMDALNHQMDSVYKAGMNHWLTRPAARTTARLAADVRESFLNNLNFETGGVVFTVKDVYSGSLEELMAPSSPLNNITINPNQTLYMGYVVTFLSDVDVDDATWRNNDVQGENVQFTFRALFEQTANNN